MTKNYFFLLVLFFPFLAGAQVIDDSHTEPYWIRPFKHVKQLKQEILWDKQPESYLDLGKAYLTGRGVKKNTAKAKKYLKKAAQKGHKEAQLLLALIPVYQEKPKPKPAELDKSFQTVLALAKQDYPLAQYELSVLYKEGKATQADPQQHLHYLQLAATAPLPVPAAQETLASYYQNGYPPYIQKDSTKAFELFLSAAQAADPDAAYQLAQMYLNAEGIEKNEKRAFHFMRQAALQKVIPAQIALSQFYLNGTGVQADEYGAFKWMLEAAKQGNTYAQEQTALYYWQGTGVRKDRQEALFWAARAQQNGSAQAANIIRQIQEEL